MERKLETENASKVILLALDAASLMLVQKWCDEGLLPTIQSLKKQWPWLKLQSMTHIGSGAAWPSLYMGITPGQHGIYFPHRQLISGTYQIGKFYAKQILKKPPFWYLAGKGGKKIATFDIPYTHSFEDKDLKGIQIVGWGNLADYSNKGSWPTELMKEVKEQFGCHPLDGWYHNKPKTVEEWKELREKFIESVRRRGAIAKHLLNRDDWDLFFADFEESHYIGHFFWHLMDPDHPDHDSEGAKVVGQTIFDLYKEIDRALAQLITNVQDSTIFIFSNQGMGPNYGGNHLLPEILARLGMSGKKDEKPVKGPRTARTLLQNIPNPMIQQVKRLIPTKLWDTWTRRVIFLGNNWKNSKAFFMPSDYAGGIRINLKDREPHGKVDPGREYDTVCRDLIRELSALVNQETGKSAVRQVFRVNERYSGEHVKDLADLMVVWEEDAPIRALFSPTIGTVEGKHSDEMAMTAIRSGGHRDEAFLLAAGKHIREGSVNLEATIMDIAPTVLYLLGQPVPRYMDGKVLWDIIDEDFKARNPIHYV